MDAKDLVKQVKEDGVKFISLQFTDVTGSVKSVDMPINGLDGALEDGEFRETVVGAWPYYASKIAAEREAPEEQEAHGPLDHGEGPVLGAQAPRGGGGGGPGSGADRRAGPRRRGAVTGAGGRQNPAAAAT